MPAGFKVVNPEDNVEDGIIIEDVAHRATTGSQFVWIPVEENIKKADGTTFNVTLGRYVYKEDGTIDTGLSTLEPNEHLKTDLSSTNYFIEELKDSETENIHAKDIEDFILKANTTGGYYIGRYEARTLEQRWNKDENLTPMILKGDGYIYNYITIIQASELSRNMYKNNNFESDLMNSYAWDTAIDFLQKNDNRLGKNKVYSRQASINTETIAEKGTNNLENKDQICNIFDMSSNCREWTTEIYTVGSYAARGGCYEQNSHYTSSRISIGSSFNSIENLSFRPILYL